MTLPARAALTAVPSLDELAADPARLSSLPRHALGELYGTVARLEADLRARLLAGSPGAERAPALEDRALGIDDAARMLGMTKDSLYRKWRALGIGYRDADGHIKFSAAVLQRYIARRAGR